MVSDTLGHRDTRVLGYGVSAYRGIKILRYQDIRVFGVVGLTGLAGLAGLA